MNLEDDQPASDSGSAPGASSNSGSAQDTNGNPAGRSRRGQGGRPPRAAARLHHRKQRRSLELRNRASRPWAIRPPPAEDGFKMVLRWKQR